MTIARASWTAVAGSIVATAIAACSADGGGAPSFEPAGAESDGGGPSSSRCQEGTFVKCTCEGGKEAQRECKGGDWGVCGPCTSITEKASCGDGKCQAAETCDSCSQDCGKCPLCNTAPSCNKAMVPSGNLPAMPKYDTKLQRMDKPAIRARLQKLVTDAGPEMRMIAAALATPSTADSDGVKSLRAVFAQHPALAASMRRHLDDNGLGTPDRYRALHPEIRLSRPFGGEMGTPACGPASLRLRVGKITVVEEDDDSANDVVYCSISAEAQSGSEIRVTPPTPNLDEGQSHSFSLEAGVFWGQKGPREPNGSIRVTYDCFEKDDSTSYSNLLKTLGDASIKAGGAAGGEYGWVFGVVGVVSTVAGSALALDGDDHLFNAVQTIDAADHEKMTNGAAWTVRRHGSHGLSDWDWILHVEAWGCTKYGGLNL